LNPSAAAPLQLLQSHHHFRNRFQTIQKRKKKKLLHKTKQITTLNTPISLYITNAMRSMEDFELSCVIFKIVLLGWKRDVRGFRKSVRDLILIFLQKKSRDVMKDERFCNSSSERERGGHEQHIFIGQSEREG
jgi:hypothetical protein